MLSTKLDRFTFHGFTAARSRLRYFELIIGVERHLFKLRDIATATGGVATLLGKRDVLISKREGTALTEALSGNLNFPEIDLAEQPGWVSSGGYITAAGRPIVANDEKAPPLIAFDPFLRGRGWRGSHSRWLRRVAERLVGQNLVCFLFMASFAGALLTLTNRQLNLLFEVIGTGGEGKSSAFRLVASVLGQPCDLGNKTYQFKPNATTNWLETCTQEFSDSTMILDELQVFAGGETAATRAKLIHDLVMRVAEGQSKGRLDGPEPFVARLVTLISANQSIRTLMKDKLPDLVGPTASRLVSLPGDGGVGYGIFDSLPEEFDDSAAFMASLVAAADQDHGFAIDIFLEGLVKLRAADEAELREQIAVRVEEFYELVGLNRNSGLAVRVAEAFAIVAVAGRLAIKFGALPATWEPMKIALSCYQRHLAAEAAAEDKPCRQVLREYADRPDLIRLENGYKMMTDQEVQACAGFIEGDVGARELRIPNKSIRKLFADWDRRKDSAELKPFIIPEKGRRDNKRPVRSNKKKDRVFVFRNFD